MQSITSRIKLFTVEASNSIRAGPGYCNMAEEQDKDYKIDFINRIQIYKKEKNKSLKRIEEKNRNKASPTDTRDGRKKIRH